MNTNNLIFKTDSYKISHPKQYPAGHEYTQLYIESRGGMYDRTMVAGINTVCKILEQGVSKKDVKQARKFFARHFGRDDIFYNEGWNIIATELQGKLPLSIRAIPEGEVVPTRTPLVLIENTDPRFAWLPGHFETLILRCIWYQTTVATISLYVKQQLYKFLMETEGNISSLPFKLHDFGSRGTESGESAAVGGSSHLYNFWGSDTIEGAVELEDTFGINDMYPCVAYSIPAREHATTTIYENEDDAFKNSIKNWGDGIYAMVIDSYDYEAAVERLTTGELRNMIEEADGTCVLRPDSGDPVTVVLRVLEIAGNNAGYTTNAKGYKLLNPHYRVIQGDGVNPKSIVDILTAMKEAGWSAENIAFGMGGELLQKLNRDTQKFACKMCAAVIDGKLTAVSKNPKSDPSKASKAGYLDVVVTEEDPQNYNTVAYYYPDTFGESGLDSVMRTYFVNGETVRKDSLINIRNISDKNAANPHTKITRNHSNE